MVSDKDTRKICPLILKRKDDPWCREERCAWWCRLGDEGMCAIRAACFKLNHIEEAIEEGNHAG